MLILSSSRTKKVICSAFAALNPDMRSATNGGVYDHA